MFVEKLANNEGQSIHVCSLVRDELTVVFQGTSEISIKSTLTAIFNKYSSVQMHEQFIASTPRLE